MAQIKLQVGRVYRYTANISGVITVMTITPKRIMTKTDVLETYEVLDTSVVINRLNRNTYDGIRYICQILKRTNGSTEVEQDLQDFIVLPEDLLYGTLVEVVE